MRQLVTLDRHCRRTAAVSASDMRPVGFRRARVVQPAARQRGLELVANRAFTAAAATARYSAARFFRVRGGGLRGGRGDRRGFARAQRRRKLVEAAATLRLNWRMAV